MTWHMTLFCLWFGKMSKHFEIIFYLCQLVDIHSRGGTDNTSFQKYFWIVEIFHQIYILRMWSDLNYCIRQHCYNYTKHRLALKLHKTNSFKIWIPRVIFFNCDLFSIAVKEHLLWINWSSAHFHSMANVPLGWWLLVLAV